MQQPATSTYSVPFFVGRQNKKKIYSSFTSFFSPPSKRTRKENPKIHKPIESESYCMKYTGMALI